MTEPKEFTHIEVRAVRNPEWLKQFSKHGFYLSEDFPLGEFELPPNYENMTEDDIDSLRKNIKSVVNLKERVSSEKREKK